MPLDKLPSKHIHLKGNLLPHIGRNGGLYLTQKHSSDNLIGLLHEIFSKTPDVRRNHPSFSLADAMMSSFAMFSLKHPSLLQMEKRSATESGNIKAIYQIKRIPSDTQMRTILDQINPDKAQDAFNAVHGRLTDLLPGYGFEIKTGSKASPYFIISIDEGE